MKAALVSKFGEPPRYMDAPAPEPAPGEVLVTVEAAALSQLARVQAAGKHYSSGAAPLVPGVDGVGLLDGRRVYFAFPRAPHGAMAEQTVVASKYVVALPEALDAVTAAALANPGMSSWAGLTRAGFQRGESVLILGATGASGRLAIQIAKHLRAGRVIAIGRTARSVEPLRELGADVMIPLEQDAATLQRALRAEVERGVDVVLDYLWGAPAEQLLAAVSGHAVDQGTKPLRFVQIGSLAGDPVQLSSAYLRSAPVTLLGSGLGSTSKKQLIDAIAGVFQAAVPGGLRISTQPLPLTEVESGWNLQTDARVVFTSG